MRNKTSKIYNWKDDLLDSLLLRKIVLEELIMNKTKSVNAAPEGGLRTTVRKNCYQYFRRTDPEDTNGKYITKNDRHLAKQLAQRDYDRDVLHKAQKEFALISRYVEHLKNNSLIDVYENLNPARKILVEPVCPDDEHFIRGWRTQEYKPLAFDDVTAEFYSNSGVRVRSKSELIIANMLEKYGIPYRYEYPLMLNGNDLVRPDFLCLNINRRREYIWEHFGMMDSIPYANKNVAKIASYELSGYHAGENMIMTFETSMVSIKSNVIKTMIEKYLI